MSKENQKDRNNAAVIEISSVSKAFAARAVLKSIDLNVTRSQAVCLCGVNGAGKSTLLRIVAGLLHADTGSVSLNGYSVRAEPEKTKPQLGVISHKSMIYPDLTVSENLSFFANLYGVKDITARIAELLKDVGLFSYRYDNAAVLSRGLLQRLAIARALVHRPQVLLADEPFTGLDAEASKYLVGVFANFIKAGGTIVMTTHNTHTGLQCCDRVVVLDKHRLIFDARTTEIDTVAFTKDYLSYARSRN
jgi:heme exporter protein A